MFGGKRARVVRRAAMITFLTLVAATLTPTAPANAAEGGEAVVANVAWRVRVGSRPDLMTTITPGERDSFYNEGQIYYLPRYQYGGTRPLYRLFHPNWYGHMDHMESVTAGEAGFQTEAPVGYAYSSSSGGYGLSQYLRTFNGCNGDHGNRSVHEPAKSCYGDEGIAAYGWPRFAHTSWSPLTLTAGGVTIESNRVAGGALFHWTHNGVQYINNRDYGRQMQSSVFFSRGGVQANPTEAGDKWTDYDRPPWARHGSPVAAASNNSSTVTQSTRSVPIDFVPENFGGSPDNPVVYKDMLLGKDVTLNWGGLGPVARYSTVFASPALSNANIEVPTAYLRAEFNRFFTYDAISRTLREVYPENNCPDAYRYVHYTPPNRGGVIIANADLSRAMGVYGANTAVGGSVSEFLLGNFIGGACGGGTGEFNFSASKWSVIRSGGLGSGTKVFNTWVMTGGVNSVTGYMNQLATWGNG